MHAILGLMFAVHANPRKPRAFIPSKYTRYTVLAPRRLRHPSYWGESLPSLQRCNFVCLSVCLYVSTVRHNMLLGLMTLYQFLRIAAHGHNTQQTRTREDTVQRLLARLQCFIKDKDST